LIADIQKGARVADLSRRFHNGLVAVLVEVAEKIRAKHELPRVCLSGCFHNVLLFESLLSHLREKQFEVYFTAKCRRETAESVSARRGCRARFEEQWKEYLGDKTPEPSGLKPTDPNSLWHG
jgi:hypothetical protein